MIHVAAFPPWGGGHEAVIIGRNLWAAIALWESKRLRESGHD